MSRLLLFSNFSIRKIPSAFSLFHRCSSGDSSSTIKIGNVSKSIRVSSRPELVPSNYLPQSLKHLPSRRLEDLQWLMQKDIMGQDVFLIGRPGSTRRLLAMQYLQLIGAEVEYVALSRDTTESDLKQRREIIKGAAHYIDQSAVRAACLGRILILDGIEKAERNVLPVLNNLLENREMHLEDGRLLISHSRYDKLLTEHGSSTLDEWKLVRVSEHFRVIALGLPVPTYTGHSLDPPLRSRFQARNVDSVDYKTQLSDLKSLCPSLNPSSIASVLSFAHTLTNEEVDYLGFPDFPLDNVHWVISLMNKAPLSTTPYEAITRLFPYKIFALDDSRRQLEKTFDTFGISPSGKTVNIKNIIKNSSETTGVAELSSGDKININLGNKNPDASNSAANYVPTEYHEQLLAEMLVSHSQADFCLIGPKGCGKSIVVQRLADILGYEMEPLMFYQDMTARDLLQQRTTDVTGNTVWRISPLVQAAVEGKLLVLDGIHRVHKGTLGILHRLVHDREIQLHDGSRVLHPDVYDSLPESDAKDDVLRVHPSFRIVALAEPPTSENPWLNSEALSSFLFHQMRPLSLSEETKVVQKVTGDLTPEIKKLLDFSHALRSSDDPSLASLSSSLSTRQILRSVRRMKLYGTNPFDSIKRACLSQFLPSLPKEALDSFIELNFLKERDLMQKDSSSSKVIISKDGKTLTIGKTSAPILIPESGVVKVPDTLFYDTPQNLKSMENMLKDLLLGEHLLLVGNQGVGKNKLVDRLLHLLNRPREYIQLHRDTTVGSLTSVPTVKNGIIVYEDSPLVKAAKSGNILVIDEADKAPTHITCVLKTLIESGEMILSDGRRISKNSGSIRLHPNFRTIVLANRPGFPFLGNDFFGSLGDLFSCHAVENPDLESELSMLRQYGPNVPEETLNILVKIFSELRSLSDEGSLNYPYSTREVINIVKHLQAFPQDGLPSVVGNVFDFDSYDKETVDSLEEILRKNGIPYNVKRNDIRLSHHFPLSKPVSAGIWSYSEPYGSGSSRRSVLTPSKTWSILPETVNVDGVKARGFGFNEIESYVRLPFHEHTQATGLAVTSNLGDDLIHVLTTPPFWLYSLTPDKESCSRIKLSDYFKRSSRPRSIEMTSLSGTLSNYLVFADPNSSDIFSWNSRTNDLTKFSTGSFIDVFIKKSSTSSIVFDKSSNTGAVFTSGENSINILEFCSAETNLDGIVLNSIDNLPFNINSVNVLSRDSFLIQTSDNINIRLKLNLNEYEMTSITVPKDISLKNVHITDGDKTLGGNIVVNSNPESYASSMIGFPDSKGDQIFSWNRDFKAYTSTDAVFLPNTGQIVSSLSPTELPQSYKPSTEQDMSSLLAYLQVVDLSDEIVRFFPVPFSGSQNSLYWLRRSPSWKALRISKLSSDDIVTVDYSGNIIIWETSLSELFRSLNKWKSSLQEGSKRLEIQRDGVDDLDSPKHGKIDPDNAPHFGGNTWAGGTGGRDTAGLGGVGGPYRLDAGHDVHQVPEEAKEAVPEHIKEAARAMNREAFSKHLNEIKMSSYDSDLYQSYHQRVSKQIKFMRAILSSLEAREKDRQWIKNQNSGELDDGRLVEGIAGEKNIYKKRADQDPEPGSVQTKPKILRLVVDVSGSMYRFNGHDQRLERTMESALMIMESFNEFEDKILYDLVGHSGEDVFIPFVLSGSTSHPVPSNEKEKLEVLRTMAAHSQFCMSGDNTIGGTHEAIISLASKAENYDESIVIVLSDANFDRYGIRPQAFGKILNKSEKVKAYAIFIGSLGSQAESLTKALPQGKSYVCLETKKIPDILKTILTSTMLK